MERATATPTLVCLHAHPDDEAILTGGLLAKAAAKGLRTVVVYATRGEAGETEADLGHQTLGQRRAAEAVAACTELGVGRIEFLDYTDSGMAGTPTNTEPTAFANASSEAVAAEVAELLVDEQPLAVVGYDANGTYGHPDHLQITRVADHVARLVGAPWLLDATYSREQLADLPGSDGQLDPTFASGQAELTHFVQGEQWFKAKMEAVKQHASQAPRSTESKRRRSRSIDGWRGRFGTEWFIARRASGEPERQGPSFGLLADVLEPKSDWPGPLTR